MTESRVLTVEERATIDVVRTALEVKLGSLDALISRLIGIKDIPRDYLRHVDDLRRNLGLAVMRLDDLQVLDDKAQKPVQP